MQSALLAAVLLLAALVAADLLLTVGVIRRMREIESRIGGLPPVPPTGPEPGSALVAHHATTVDGSTLDEQWWRTGRRLVAVFSSGCSACRDHLPGFLRVAATLGPDSAVAVIGGAGAEAAGLLDALRGRVPVVVEPELGPLTAALDARVFPTFVLAVDGTVTATASHVDLIAHEVPA